MSSRVKKDRRRSGVKFSKPTKVPTPLEQRREFRENVAGAIGTRDPQRIRPRSEKQLRKMRSAWGLEP